MAKEFVDGFGSKWRYVHFHGGEMRRVRDYADHEDVQLEQREILKDRKLLGNAFWLIVAIAGALTSVAIGTLIYLARSKFPTPSLFIFAVVTSCAISSGLLVAYSIQLRSRIHRMEFHLLTIHNEILTIKGCLERPEK